MRQITHKIGKEEYVFQEVAQDSFDFEIIGASNGSTHLTDLWFDNSKNEDCFINISPYENLEKRLKIIGVYPKVDVIKLAEALFGKIEDIIEGNEVPFMFSTSHQAVLSLFKSLGIETNNKYGEKPERNKEYLGTYFDSEGWYLNNLKQWEAAENDRWKKIVILKKNQS